MPLSELTVTNLRNIESAHLQLHESLNVIYGANGSGKTSLLEAIYLLGRGRSFKTASGKKIIRQGHNVLTVFGVTDHRPSRTIGVEISESGFRAKAGGNRLHKSSELAQLLPLLLITPNADKLVQGSPRQRRNFVDWNLFHVEQGYLENWQKFNRALNHRNALLKTKSVDELELWNQQLCLYGDYISETRTKFIAQLEPKFQNYCVRLMGDQYQFGLRYRRGWAEEVDFQQALVNYLDRDRKSGFTQRGPHRADLIVLDHQLGDAALLSGGQSKLVACALILAQVETLSAAGLKTSLLVDDLPAELDRQHRERFLSLLQSIDSQLFITTTDLDLLDKQALEAGYLFHVEHGDVKLISET